MKKHLILLVLLNSLPLLSLLAQSNFEMVVESNDGKKTVFNTSDINQVYFQNKEEIDNNEKSCVLKSFYLTDGKKDYHSFTISDSVVQVIVDNNADLTKIKACFTYDGNNVTIKGVEQKSGITENDFSDFCNPIIYTVNDIVGGAKNYKIEIYNLPIVYIETPDGVAITSREEWVENSSFIIRNTDGSVEDYGEANVKGRGNWSWSQAKKPYAIKLANKPKGRTVLGMPPHKRWVLLANPLDYLPNALGFEVNRRTESCKWSPRCRYVELFLNGEYKGLYLLVEQIKIDKNRIDISEMRKTDIDGDAVTGGYLISYDDAYDEAKFRSRYYNMPVLIKNPDDDDIVPEQWNYITNYIDEAEYSLFDEEKFQSGGFYNYFNVDSWIDYYFAEELWGAYELKRPRSVWLYKDKNDKLTAGPVWDLEQNYFDKQILYCNEALYYKRLFQRRDVVENLQKRWVVFQSNLLGNEKYNNILEYLDSLYSTVHLSARRDRQMTPSSHNNHLSSPESTIDLEYETIKNGIIDKIKWLNDQIMSW